jgi:hypothetical protein
MTEQRVEKRAIYKPQVEEIQRELSQAETIDDFFGKEGIFARLFARTLEEMLAAELSAQLGYEKYEAKGRNSGNSRNGTRTKQVQSSAGEQTITVPRDRNGAFASPLLAGQRSNELEEKVISLYAKGSSTRDIQTTLAELYGVEVTAPTISAITDKVWPLVEQWQNRALAEIYAIVYLDAFYVKLRREGKVENVAIYDVLGVNLDGHKEVLGHWVGAGAEGANFWLSVLTLVVSLDGSEVGRGCLTLMVSLIYQRRAIPLVWLVVARPKGHLSAQAHISLLVRLQALLPAEADVIVLGDGEFDSIELQRYLHQQGWHYVCRTAKDTWVSCESEWLQLDDWALPDLCLGLEQVAFTEQAYGPVTVVVWWDQAYQAPIFLVSNLTLTDEICYWYRKRMRIETFFSDQKSRGFQLHKSHVADPARLARILIAACLAYLWIIYLGAFALQHGYVALIHRSDRCDLSLFQLGLAFLDHCLNERWPIPLDLKLPVDLLFA